MDFNEILQQGAQAFKARLDLNGDGKVDVAEVTNALKGLLSDEKGEINLASIVEKMRSSGLAELAQSWLSTGKNEPVFSGQLAELFGKEKIAAFAEKLGLRQISALNGLVDALPQVVDKSSPDGTLLEPGAEPTEAAAAAETKAEASEAEEKSVSA